MDTNYIKKHVIAEILGKLFSGTCDFSPNSLGAGNCTIEPDINALIEFRNLLSELAEIHFYNELTVDDIKRVMKYVYPIGHSVHHIWGDGTTTGTWGNRYTTLQNIITILSLPDKNLLPIKSVYHLYDKNHYILGYSLTTFAIFVEIEPCDLSYRKFSIDFYYKDMLKDTCPIYQVNK